TRSGWRRPEPGAARVRKYLGRRAAYAAGTLLGVSVIIFVVLRILPGDPLVAILGVEGHARMSKEDRVRIMADLGLSDPLPVQYGRWLVDIAAGRLGKSFFRGDTVAELIAHRGPISAEIGLLALVISWLVGLPVGILSAFKPNSVPDGVARTLSVLFIAIPGVLLGFVLGGSVAVEQAFGVPGLGRALVTAVVERDIIVVQNLVLLYASIFVVVNVLVDLSYAWLDPRIRF